MAGLVSAGSPQAGAQPAAAPAGPPGAKLLSAASVAPRIRPTTLAGERMLEVPAPLSGLFPGGGLRRGSTLAVSGEGGTTSLALFILSAPSSAGSWCGFVGADSLGALAAAESGVDLGRLALVRSPGPLWAPATAALLEGLDVVVLRLATPARLVEARRLAARARQHGSVLVVLSLPGAPSRAWPEVPEVSLVVRGGRWRQGAEGRGSLGSRRVEVVSRGRGAASREKSLGLWLPGPDGTVCPVAGADGTARPVGGPDGPAVEALPVVAG